MSIVSSVFSLGAVQKDGRVYVTETHTDNLSVAHIVSYLSAQGANFTAIMNARAAVIAQSLVDAEVNKWLSNDSGTAITLSYASKSDFVAPVRAAYGNSSRQETARLAKWVLDHIDNADFTETQVRNAFNLTLTQWNTLKAKMMTLRTEYNDMLAAAGE